MARSSDSKTCPRLSPRPRLHRRDRELPGAGRRSGGAHPRVASGHDHPGARTASGRWCTGTPIRSPRSVRRSPWFRRTEPAIGKARSDSEAAPTRRSGVHILFSISGLLRQNPRRRTSRIADTARAMSQEDVEFIRSLYRARSEPMVRPARRGGRARLHGVPRPRLRRYAR